MKIEVPYDRGLNDESGIDIRYYGEDAKNFLESINWHKEVDYIGKECITTEGESGTIVGFEESNSFMDYYFIVYVPEKDCAVYELANAYGFKVML